MAALKIEPADDSPLVILDKENEVFEISGKSMPEDVIGFYQPVFEWITKYNLDPVQETVFVFKLIYFNTASSKVFLDILMMLEEIHQKGSEVLIKWHSLPNDEDMRDAGEEYAEMTGLPFEYHIFEL